MNHGPRIIVKADANSSIGRGCILYGAHFRPEMACIPYWVARTAPEELDEVVLTEGWRDVRDSRDLHEELRGIDVSLNGLADGGGESKKSKAESWAARLRERLGSDYQVILHGDGLNYHMHCELDP